ncbi:MAG: SH3 domain-containing protein [Candidatus Aminicenantes bacterium]|nr:SH3 domain-containing protein [Candidatus Aminicenantes bacterium]
MKIPKSSALAACVLAVICLAAAADALVVKIQTTQLRTQPQFFAPVVANLKAGDSLTQVGESGAWLQVKTATGLNGWVHRSAVEVPRYALMASAGGTKTQATASEAALAGKGFSKQVEDNYRAGHAEANFPAVDRMLLVKIYMSQVKEFLDQGKLGGQGGGR